MAPGLAAVSYTHLGPRDYQRTPLTAIKEGKWQEALDAVARCIRVYAPRIKMLGLDDGFGWFYYQKGVCLAQLKNYKEAVEAFKACYTKFQMCIRDSH